MLALAKLEGRMDGFDIRFDGMERRFDSLERRFDAVDRRFDTVDRRFEALDAKSSRQFWWLLGTQLTVFVTVISVLAGALFAR